MFLILLPKKPLKLHPGFQPDLQRIFMGEHAWNPTENPKHKPLRRVYLRESLATLAPIEPPRPNPQTPATEKGGSDHRRTEGIDFSFS